MAAASLSLVSRPQERSVAPLAQRSLFPGPLVLWDPQNAAAVQALSQRESEHQAAQNHALVARVETFKSIVLAQQQENALLKAESLGSRSRESESRLCFEHRIKAKTATYAEILHVIDQKLAQAFTMSPEVAASNQRGLLQPLYELHLEILRNPVLPVPSADSAGEDPIESLKRRDIKREVEAFYIEKIKAITQGIIETREATQQLVEPMLAKITHLEQQCSDLDHLVQSKLTEIARLKKGCSDLNRLLVLEKETSKLKEAVAQERFARTQEEFAHERRCFALKEQFAEDKLTQLGKHQEEVSQIGEAVAQTRLAKIKEECARERRCFALREQLAEEKLIHQEQVNAQQQETILSQSQMIQDLSSQIAERMEPVDHKATKQESAFERHSPPHQEGNCIIS